MDTVTHIAVGNDLGQHFRIIDGWWHLCRPGETPIKVTVPKTLAALHHIATIGQP